MQFLGTVRMESCDTTTEDASLEQVLEAAGTGPLDEDWFLTLTRANEDFLDISVNDDGSLHVVCDSDDDRLICEAADPGLVKELARSFYAHDNAWKQLCEWQPPKKKGLLGRLLS
jgi:hypothetical protein